MNFYLFIKLQEYYSYPGRLHNPAEISLVWKPAIVWVTISKYNIYY